VVLKYLYHSTDPELISQELSILGLTVRNITNIRHRITKEQPNLFFIDLEPALNNKEVYNITALQNRIIHFEPPRINKMRIPQCTTARHARKVKTRQQNVPCVVKTNQPTVKAVSVTTKSCKGIIPTELTIPASKLPLTRPLLIPQPHITPCNNNTAVTLRSRETVHYPQTNHLQPSKPS